MTARNGNAFAFAFSIFSNPSFPWTDSCCCCGRAADIVLDGRLQVSGGAPSAPQLQLALLNSSSAAFQQAARFYTTLVSHASAMPPPLQIEDSPFNCMPLCE